jgi:cysteine desulfurase
VTYLPVDRHGRVDPDDVRRAMSSRTILVSVMAANNEIGVMAPLEEIGRIAKENGVFFHTDAVQAAGKVPFDVGTLHVDLVSLTAHKMYGPKGVGALYVRRRNPRVELAPIIHGGGHERGLRSGTLNVPGIVGFGKAAALCREEMAEESTRLAALRDRLYEGITSGLDGVLLNGPPTDRLPHNLNVSFGGLEGESLLMAINDVAVATGSACTSASKEPSHVLTAIGVPDDLAQASIRFSLGRFTTAEEIDYVVAKIRSIVPRLREMSPLTRSADDELDNSDARWDTE